jgi:hypothetical protein
MQICLEALKKTIFVGKCNVPKPWYWEHEELVKWSAWHDLEDVPELQAMQLYVQAACRPPHYFHAVLRSVNVQATHAFLCALACAVRHSPINAVQNALCSRTGIFVVWASPCCCQTRHCRRW